MTNVLKSQKYYNDNKRKFNKLYGFQMKKVVTPECVGFCSYIYQKFMDQWESDELPTVQDFANFYFTFLDDNATMELSRPNSKYYGRSIEDIWRLAAWYLEMCDDLSLTQEQCYDDIVNHVIVETFNGQIREAMLSKEYESKGFKLEHTYGFWDKDLGVDFIVRNKDGIIKSYIQCKPLSFFSPYANPSCISDRVMAFTKESKKKEYCEENGLPYYPTRFIIYNNDYPDKWCSMNGKRSFLAEDIMNKDGKIIMNLKKIQYS